MPFSYLITGYGPKQLLSDTIDREAIKVGPTPAIKTAFLVMALCQKLRSPYCKSYVNPLRTVVTYMHHGKMEFHTCEQIAITLSSLA